ncbi:hypothetical protein CLAFUW4_02400 [Fulvia fulva]|uniref:Uncharacterized protein n=1 Tax=Passalora fulva TaxID=5499 RepID=A0A9Q8LAT8_PASFU|nr:uncharacterized protein CLAFUR5_02388 [Fulvia fulva]KAK4631995.1 hypothetical protein CLAFUR4_02395 [Fulvia fulva]KAK4633364.1 hypothetical protein CLAFUR0_02399 [Fulvia fulva]UJO13962.1 hypothetical protein CLAFUR5_02388 [Fulvia fulva]WPV11544.1 hypothetical protein CLAFUW4_02400 [Fulvia fulva]WPV26407.1 hypothetical protein CLAFUW7_02400 [Fulvia fulva]
MDEQDFARNLKDPKSQDSHVPVNNFNLDELVRHGTSQNIPTTYIIDGVSSRDTSGTAIMPMADGTSLLHVIEQEIVRVGNSQAVADSEALEMRKAAPTQDVDKPGRHATDQSKPAGASDTVPAPEPTSGSANAGLGSTSHATNAEPLPANGRREFGTDQSKPSGEIDTVPAPVLIPGSTNLDSSSTSHATRVEPATYWVERPFNTISATPDRLLIIKPKDMAPVATTSRTSVVEITSKASVDPKVELVLRPYKVPDRHNEFTSKKHVSLNTTIRTLLAHLEDECRKIVYGHRPRLSMIAQANQCFHIRACPDMTTEPSRNFYITNDDQSACRFKQVRGLFHTHQVEAAARDDTPLSLRFLVEMGETKQPVYGSDEVTPTYQDFRPELALWSVSWDKDYEQDVKMMLMTPIVQSVAERRHVEIDKDLTGTTASQDFGLKEQDQKFNSIVSQISVRDSQLRQPIMTFNRYERPSSLAPASPPAKLYLAIRVFTHFRTIEIADFQPPTPILLKLPTDRTADKIKRALIQELQAYCNSGTTSQTEPSYRAAFTELLRDDNRAKWTLQLWAMPQSGQRKRLHICRKKEEFGEFLAEGGGDGVYVEAHFVPSEEAVNGIEEKRGRVGCAGEGAGR